MLALDTCLILLVIDSDYGYQQMGVLLRVQANLKKKPNPCTIQAKLFEAESFHSEEPTLDLGHLAVLPNINLGLWPERHFPHL